MTKYFYHIRHSMRKDRSNNESFLSQKGIDLARKRGEEFREQNIDFSHVVTSIWNRAIQTPIAMGWAVDDTTEAVIFSDTIMQELSEMQRNGTFDWFSDFAAFTNTYNISDNLLAYCDQQLELYKESLNQIDDGESLLLVTHGGFIDFPLIHMFPNANHSEWDHTFRYVEGYKVKYDGTFNDLKFIR